MSLIPLGHNQGPLRPPDQGATAIRTSPVSQMFEEQDKQQGILQEMISVLEDRLAAVLTPAQPGPGKWAGAVETPNKLSAEPPIVLSDLAQIFARQTTITRKCRQRIEALLERIEL